MSRYENFSKYLTYDLATNSSEIFYNHPRTKEKQALKLLGEHIYDPLIEEFGEKIRILSCFRSRALNASIGHRPGPHSEGIAMDITSIDETLPNSELFEWIYHNLEYDCIVWVGKGEIGWCTNEDPLWIHIAYKKVRNRNVAYREHLDTGSKIIKRIYR